MCSMVQKNKEKHRLCSCCWECRSCCYGLYRRLQSVQNAAAPLVSGVRRRDHITPTLRRLHWLLVRQRVLFKIAVLVYQCLNGLAPSYLADDCQLLSDVRPRRLRSSDSGFCAVRRTRTTYGDRCFAVAGSRAWNSLPTELRQSDSLGQFKRRLKTHLLGYGTTALCDITPCKLAL